MLLPIKDEYPRHCVQSSLVEERNKAKHCSEMSFRKGSSSSKEFNKAETYSSRNGLGCTLENSLNRLSALIVDDDVVTRKIHKMMLTNLGVKTQEVENGKEAVDLCFSGAVFDLILMDMEMPVMDGQQATRTLRLMDVHSKVIGVSTNGQERERLQFMEAGIDQFHIKPLTSSKLISIIQEFNQ